MRGENCRDVCFWLEADIQPPRRLRTPFSGDILMALEMVPGVLDRRKASARYAPPFKRLGEQ